jgi:N-acetylglutamate synthase-like GNAT family acetyltransferase
VALEVVLRAAQPGDVPAISALVYAAYADYVPLIGREPAPMTADDAAAVAAGHTWVAEHEGTVVGVLVLEPAADHLLIENIAVSPTLQGLGLGVRLLGVADDEARRRGLPEIRLYTNAAMTKNIAFYPRHGYHETHRGGSDGFERVFFAKPVTDVRMTPGRGP